MAMGAPVAHKLAPSVGLSLCSLDSISEACAGATYSVCFIKHEEVYQVGGSYTRYQIEVTAATGESWFIWKRYSQVDDFHRTLKMWIGDKAPTLPAKRYFRTHDADFLEDRRKGLEDYLNSAIALIPAATTDLVPFVESFLGVQKERRGRTGAAARQRVQGHCGQYQECASVSPAPQARHTLPTRSASSDAGPLMRNFKGTAAEQQYSTLSSSMTPRADSRSITPNRSSESTTTNRRRRWSRQQTPREPARETSSDRQGGTGLKTHTEFWQRTLEKATPRGRTEEPAKEHPAEQAAERTSATKDANTRAEETTTVQPVALNFGHQEAEPVQESRGNEPAISNGDVEDVPAIAEAETADIENVHRVDDADASRLEATPKKWAMKRRAISAWEWPLSSADKRDLMVFRERQLKESADGVPQEESPVSTPHAGTSTCEQAKRSSY